MEKYLTKHKVLEKTKRVLCSLECQEQNLPLVSKNPSFFGHNMFCKNMNKQDISGKCAFKDFFKTPYFYLYIAPSWRPILQKTQKYLAQSPYKIRSVGHAMLFTESSKWHKLYMVGNIMTHTSTFDTWQPNSSSFRGIKWSKTT